VEEGTSGGTLEKDTEKILEGLLTTTLETGSIKRFSTQVANANNSEEEKQDHH
jgi:hypothetical protein